MRVSEGTAQKENKAGKIVTRMKEVHELLAIKFYPRAKKVGRVQS